MDVPVVIVEEPEEEDVQGEDQEVMGAFSGDSKIMYINIYSGMYNYACTYSHVDTYIHVVFTTCCTFTTCCVCACCADCEEEKVGERGGSQLGLVAVGSSPQHGEEGEEGEEGLGEMEEEGEGRLSELPDNIRENLVSLCNERYNIYTC